METGLAPAVLGLGRCCHIRLPERARLDALGEGCVVLLAVCGSLDGCCVVWAVFDVEGFALLVDPNPLKSGTSMAMEGVLVVAGVLDSAAKEEGAGLIVTGDGDAAGAGDLILLGAGDSRFCGLIDRARSVHSPISSQQRYSDTNTSNRTLKL